MRNFMRFASALFTALVCVYCGERPFRRRLEGNYAAA